MAQAKKKTATKTNKKTNCCATQKSCKKCASRQKYQDTQQSNMFFVIAMSVLAATLFFADILMMTAI